MISVLKIFSISICVSHFHQKLKKKIILICDHFVSFNLYFTFPSKTKKILFHIFNPKLKIKSKISLQSLCRFRKSLGVIWPEWNLDLNLNSKFFLFIIIVDKV